MQLRGWFSPMRLGNKRIQLLQPQIQFIGPIVWSTKTASLISMGSELMCIEATQAQVTVPRRLPFIVIYDHHDQTVFVQDIGLCRQ